MKNLSPQNHDVAEARSGGANWGANFSCVRASCPEECILKIEHHYNRSPERTKRLWIEGSKIKLNKSLISLPILFLRDLLGDLAAISLVRRREAKVLWGIGGKEMRFDLCQYYIRQLPRYKAFGSFRED
jgi:hypothetical protein